MKIFAAGLATETNTFSPLPTGPEDFLITRQRDLQAGHTGQASFDQSETWRQQARERGDQFVFSLMAWSSPGGPTLRSTYESLRDEILDDLKAAMPIDVVLLDLHGAMVAQGYEDCEGDIIRRVRAIVGPNVVIGVELDLHCHLSEAKIAAADLVITYKEYPHTDTSDRGRELFDLAVATQLGKIRPRKALFDCRMIGLYPTSRQPLRGFVDAITEAEKRPGVLSISFGHGFQFADLPHVGAQVLAITDNDAALASKLAREFGLRAYGLRRDIGFERLSLPVDQAIKKALQSSRTPVVIADQSDNTGGGAPGDCTFALRWLLEHGIENAALALIYDPEVVSIARKAGVGATLSLRLGGKLGPTSGQPVDCEATVLAVQERHIQDFPQGPEAPPVRMLSGDLVALRSAGLDIVVSNRRCQCFNPAVFSDLGIDFRARRLLIVKSSQHFHAAFAPIGGEIIYMSASGGAVPPDPRQVSYRKLNTARLYPWADDPLAAATLEPAHAR